MFENLKGTFAGFASTLGPIQLFITTSSAVWKLKHSRCLHLPWSHSNVYDCVFRCWKSYRSIRNASLRPKTIAHFWASYQRSSKWSFWASCQRFRSILRLIQVMISKCIQAARKGFFSAKKHHKFGASLRSISIRIFCSDAFAHLERFFLFSKSDARLRLLWVFFYWFSYEVEDLLRYVWLITFHLGTILLSKKIRAIRTLVYVSLRQSILLRRIPSWLFYWFFYEVQDFLRDIGLITFHIGRILLSKKKQSHSDARLCLFETKYFAPTHFERAFPCFYYEVEEFLRYGRLINFQLEKILPSKKMLDSFWRSSMFRLSQSIRGPTHWVSRRILRRSKLRTP